MPEAHAGEQLLVAGHGAPGLLPELLGLGQRLEPEERRVGAGIAGEIVAA